MLQLKQKLQQQLQQARDSCVRAVLLATVTYATYPNLTRLAHHLSPIGTLLLHAAEVTRPARSIFERAPSNRCLKHTTLKLTILTLTVMLHFLNLLLITWNNLLSLLNLFTPFTFHHGGLVLANPKFGETLKVNNTPISDHLTLLHHFLLTVYVLIIHATTLSFYLLHRLLLHPYDKVKHHVQTLKTIDYELLYFHYEERIQSHLNPLEPPPSLSILFTPPQRSPRPLSSRDRPDLLPTEEDYAREAYAAWRLSFPIPLPLHMRFREYRRKPIYKAYSIARRVKRTIVKHEETTPYIRMYPEPWCSQEEIAESARLIHLEGDRKNQERGRERRELREKEERRNKEMVEEVKRETWARINGQIVDGSDALKREMREERERIVMKRAEEDKLQLRR